MPTPARLFALLATIGGCAAPVLLPPGPTQPSPPWEIASVEQREIHADPAASASALASAAASASGAASVSASASASAAVGLLRDAAETNVQRAVPVGDLAASRLAGEALALRQRLVAWLGDAEEPALEGVARPQTLPARAPSALLLGLVRHGVLADFEAAADLERRLCDPHQGEDGAARHAACLLDGLVLARLAAIEGAATGPRSQRPPPSRRGRDRRAEAEQQAAEAARRDADLRAIALTLATGGGDAETVDSWLDAAGPMRFPPYQRLLDGLHRYRALAPTGWGTLPSNIAIASAKAHKVKGEAAAWREALLPAHRAALASRLGTEAGEAIEADAIEPAILAFQRRHGLRPTGLLDATTRRAMDVPVTTRVDQIRLSLQRIRDASIGGDARYGIANVPAFRVDFYRDGALWRSHATQVGKATRKTRTPLLQADLRYLVLNPEWIVPTSIQREIRRKVAKDPDYLRKHGYREYPGGKMVMGAGAENLLGAVKFLFPNEHLVYLHDTPNQWAFRLPKRLQSHGCVRVQDALQLARALLDEDEADDAPISDRRWKKMRAQAEDKWLALKHPFRMNLVYWTADAVPLSNGEVELRFYPDVYRYDARDRKQAEDALAGWIAPS